MAQRAMAVTEVRTLTSLDYGETAAVKVSPIKNPKR